MGYIDMEFFPVLVSMVFIIGTFAYGIFFLVGSWKNGQVWIGIWNIGGVGSLYPLLGIGLVTRDSSYLSPALASCVFF